jgi:putative tricarboxylic transport membrane protein
MRRLPSAIAILWFSLAVGLPVCPAATPEWRPDRNVEFNVQSGPGSGSDVLARTLQSVWQAKGLVRPSVTVVNKPSALAMAHVHQQAGNGHYLLMASTTFLTNQIVGVSPLRFSEFTPVAILGDEPIIFSVRADSTLKSGRDLVQLLAKDPKAVSFGLAAALGNHNHCAVALVMKEAGGDVRDLKIVVFDSSSKGMTALLGGHVDVYATSIDSAVPHILAGKARALGVASEKRIRDDMGSVPTWREQGFNIVACDVRIVAAPGKLNDAQIAYWDDVFARTMQSDEWKKFDSVGYSVPYYLPSREAGRLLEMRYGVYRGVLTELGLAKSP